MHIARTLDDLRTAVARLKQNGAVALVPTMGALHEGHLALVDEAAKAADHVVVSIFVNPKQFGPNEDLDAYPRQPERDADLLRARNVAILWLPPVDVMYPQGFATNISVSGVSEGLCGGARPGHFDGVATVVTKLLLQVQPDVALFGEKDYQQLAVIRRFVADLNLPVAIKGVAIQRAEDGLALSSRNVYLSETERDTAPRLHQTLQDAALALTSGASAPETLANAAARLEEAGFGPIDYLELRDAGDLALMDALDRPARLLVAARLGRTRLIDNIAVTP